MKIPIRFVRAVLSAALLILVRPQVSRAAEWQWSVPDGACRAYLWIPPQCERVRAVVVSNHNMIEQGILEHPTMRKTLAEMGIAEVWVVPYMDLEFNFNKGAGEHFEQIINALAEESGYRELRVAPVVPMGHSACATYPWNFAAWNPGRTLAILSVHGDAPQTNKTGYGRPNIEWGDHQIDGIPGLMVMGEYEWLEERLTPAFTYLAKHPKTPMAFLCDAGHGHFDYSDQLVGFLSGFIRKAAAARLPATASLDEAPVLKPIDPSNGWRIDRWRRDQSPIAAAAPFNKYKGKADEAFWCFDQQMADETEAYYAGVRGKKPQLLSVMDVSDTPQGGCGEPVTPRFIPGEDNLTFKLKTGFMDAVPADPKNANPSRWTGLPGGTPLGHATQGGPISLSRIVGPVVQTGTDSFQVSFGRAEYTPNRRNLDIWIWASHPGDKEYKSVVQQCMVRIKPNSEGADQHITFPEIPDQKAGTQELHLAATSDAGLPVRYYLREGPGEISGDTVKFTPIPPRSKFPVRVTIVAWQFGRATDPKVKTAEQVERSFYLTKPASFGH